MKTKIAQFVAFALLVLAVPAVSFADFGFTQPAAPTGAPSFAIAGTTSVSPTGANVSVSYDSTGATYVEGQDPMVTVEYTNVSTGQTMVTNPFYESNGERTSVFTLPNLTGSTQYMYRAVMKYNGMSYTTNTMTFTTTKASPGFLESFNASASNSATVPTPGSVANALGATKLTSAVKKAVYTAGSNHANGVAVAITDEQARVSQDDHITFTVAYQNARTTSLTGTQLVVTLPDQYEYVSSSDDANYDDTNNTVTFDTGHVAAGTTKYITFKAVAVGSSGKNIETAATFYYDGGKISTSDRDAYNAGSKSVLGASVFGAGFFPQTFVGWILIIILFIVIIIVARRYMKPAPPHVVVAK